MKRLIILIAATLVLAIPAKAQEAQSKDTVNVNFFNRLEKGDILPFKFLYQRLKIKEDTTVSVSVAKDIILEVTDVNDTMDFLIVNVKEENFSKGGPEAGKPKLLRTTSLVKDLSGVDLAITRTGIILGIKEGDSLFLKSQQNLDYIADTLSKNSVLSKAGIVLLNSFLTDTARVLKQVYSDLSDLFFFCDWGLIPDEVYVVSDSVYSSIDDSFFQAELLFTLDSEFSRNNPEYKDLYVLRKEQIYQGLYFLRWFGYEKPTEEALKIVEQYGNRCAAAEEVTVLADKGMGIPVLMQKAVTTGFYDETGDDAISKEFITILLDYDRLAELQGDDDDEEEDDDEPRYDDYGFIKVK